MSDHQFQEREFESGEEGPADMADLMNLLMGGPMPLSGALEQQQIQDLLNSLPRLKEEDLIKLGHGNKDATCPVCITPLPAIIAEEEMAQVMESPAHAFEEMGVTRLWIGSREEGGQGCGHIFCRRCISKWIGGGHDSCPMCRRLLIWSSSDSSTTSEPATAPPNPTEEAALRQLQYRMRAMRAAMLGNDNHPLTDGQGYHRGPQNLQDLFGDAMFEGHAVREVEHDRNEYAGMYS